MHAVIVRDVAPADEARWRELWKGYCDFYETDMPEAVTDETWRRILDIDTPSFGAVVAERNGCIIGFANYVLHPTHGRLAINACCTTFTSIPISGAAAWVNNSFASCSAAVPSVAGRVSIG